MRVLLVHAHPEPTSFTSAMKDRAVEVLTEAGHHVDVSDLYAQGFDPVAGRQDFTTVADASRFHYQSEQAHAAIEGGFVEELQREQLRVAGADAFVFTFPLWWGGVPAILKGWFDRVLAYGFAYVDGRRYDTGLLSGRAAVLGLSTGGTQKRFSAGGAYGRVDQVLWPTQHCMVEYLGLTTAEPFVAYAAPRVDAEQRAVYLNEWAARVSATLDLVDPDRMAFSRDLDGSATSWTSPV